MPVTSSAKKALRQSKRKRIGNISYLNKIKLVAKEIKKLIGEKKIKEAGTLLPKLYSALDKAAKRHVIEKNTAARKKSRTVKALKNAKT